MFPFFLVCDAWAVAEDPASIFSFITGSIGIGLMLSIFMATPAFQSLNHGGGDLPHDLSDWY